MEWIMILLDCRSEELSSWISWFLVSFVSDADACGKFDMDIRSMEKLYVYY